MISDIEQSFNCRNNCDCHVFSFLARNAYWSGCIKDNESATHLIDYEYIGSETFKEIRQKMHDCVHKKSKILKIFGLELYKRYIISKGKLSYRSYSRISLVPSGVLSFVFFGEEVRRSDNYCRSSAL